jgi:hypothetical protein
LRDSEDGAVGKRYAPRLAPLPLEAVRLRIYSRTGRVAALMGPFRIPWEFGYLMADPATITR